MTKRLDSKTEIYEFDEFQDVIMRVSSKNGSDPIVIVMNGKTRTAENIGNQILALFDYRLESGVFENAAV